MTTTPKVIDITRRLRSAARRFRPGTEAEPVTLEQALCAAAVIGAQDMKNGMEPGTTIRALIAVLRAEEAQ